MSEAQINSRIDDLKNIVIEMREEMRVFNGVTEKRFESIEDLSKLREQATHEKIATLTSSVADGFESASRLSNSKFDEIRELGTWFKWAGSIVSGVTVMILATTLTYVISTSHRAGVTEGKIDGLAGQVSDVKGSINELKKPESPEPKVAVTTPEPQPAQQPRFRFEKVLCVDIGYPEREPSSVILEMRGGILPFDKSSTIQGLYVARFLDDDSNTPMKIVPLSRELRDLPVRIVVTATSYGGGTVILQFANVEDLARFRAALPDKEGTIALEVTDRPLEQQQLKAQ